MNRLVILGIAVVAALYVLFSSIYVVNEREQAIVLRFGQITSIHEEPGLYFKIPTSIVDTVQIIEDRLLRYDIADMTVQVSGGKFYEVDAFLTYRITNPRLFRERAQGELRVVDDRIDTRFSASLRQVYGRRDFNAALSEERPGMMREVRDLMVTEMAELGIQIVDVRILRTDLTQQVSAQTFDRMKAERLAEAALLRARGQEQAQTLKAIADRQAVEIVAAARRDSEILRGEGEAARADIFAQVYNQDADFFEFYRSMQSYRTALGAQGTTMVLSPDSEFFRFFTSDGTDTARLPAPGTVVNPPVTPLTQEPGTGIDLLPLAPDDLLPEAAVEPVPGAGTIITEPATPTAATPAEEPAASP